MRLWGVVVILVQFYTDIYCFQLSLLRPVKIPEKENSCNKLSHAKLSHGR